MPRDTLNREQVVNAAIDLLDSEGLEGLNMRALGKRLGSAATAVYWHVGSKDNLIALAGDQVWSEIELPDLTAVGWRTAAMNMAIDLHAMLTRHLWLVQTFGSYPALGPAAAASLARRLSRNGGNAEVQMRDSMERAREIAARFPRLRAGLDTAAAEYAAAPENSFEFGLQAILDGLEARLVASRVAAGQKARKPPIRDQHASPHRRPMAPGRRRAL